MDKRVVLATRKLAGKGRLQVPREVRDILDIGEGDLIYFVQDEDSRIILEKAPSIRKGQIKYVVRA